MIKNPNSPVPLRMSPEKKALVNSQLEKLGFPAITDPASEHIQLRYARRAVHTLFQTEEVRLNGVYLETAKIKLRIVSRALSQLEKIQIRLFDDSTINNMSFSALLSSFTMLVDKVVLLSRDVDGALVRISEINNQIREQGGLAPLGGGNGGADPIKIRDGGNLQGLPPDVKKKVVLAFQFLSRHVMNESKRVEMAAQVDVIELDKDTKNTASLLATQVESGKVA